MKNRFFLVIATVAAVALMTSCGKVPQAGIDAANAAIDSAKVVEADIYLPGDFTALNDSMTVIMQDIEAQKSKLFKSYKTASAKLEALKAQAGTVATSAVAKKAEVKAEAEAGLVSVKALLDEVKGLIAKAPRGKDAKAVLEQMKGEVDAAEATITEAQTLFDAGTNYMQVADKITATTKQLNDLKAELEEVMAKVKR